MSDATKGRVAVALSGGVDSAVAAALLLREGLEVLGVTLRLHDCTEALDTRSCCGVDGMVRARAVAGHLGIRHYVLDATDAFERDVLRPAWDEYDRGRTPSPCLLCNERMKFGTLLAWARSVGATTLATGHYARIGRDAEGRPALLRGADPAKDQSYFLAGLDAARLSALAFPLGGMTKPEVRALAATLDLPSSTARDSQDACLVGRGQTFAGMLRERFGADVRPGVVVDDDGVVVGRHGGLHAFTVGQRQAIPIRTTGRLWVRRIDGATAALHITADESRLLAPGLRASGLSWVAGAPPADDFRAEVQERYRQPPVDARVRVLADGSVEVAVDVPLRAVSPGQAVVIYDRDRVLGRGWIDDAG
jgi:tRNA-specific 2-thiouridylase